MGNRSRIIIILISIGFIFNCQSKKESPSSGTLIIEFEHLVDGADAGIDQMIYENAAGNEYEITNIQWFISDITLVNKNGMNFPIEGEDWIHYIDTDIAESLIWKIDQDIPAGEYESIRFTFGIKGEKNTPNRFTDPPESNMIWPYPMGGDEGGYHYMKLNGFWKNLDLERTPFNFHIGVGQVYNDQGDVIEFVQNWFEKELPSSSFSMPAEKTVRFAFKMNIENWFKGPHDYDHNLYGSKIMKNQEAMGIIKENGTDVFSVVLLDYGENT